MHVNHMYVFKYVDVVLTAHAPVTTKQIPHMCKLTW